MGAPDDGDAQMWFFMGPDESRLGPVPASELTRMVRDGEIDNTLVWTEGMGDWRMLADFPQLLPQRSGGQKRKRNPTHTVPPEIHQWLEGLEEAVLANLWVLSMDVEDILDGMGGVRDRLLASYVERDAELDGDPEDFDFTDDFFWDVIEVLGARETWKILSLGNEDDMKALIARAAALEEKVLSQIESSHQFKQVTNAIDSDDQQTLLALLDKSPHLLSTANQQGKTPLFISVEASKLDLVRAAIEWHNARMSSGEREVVSLDDLNGQGNTVLHLAADAGNAEMARLLLENEADPNIQNYSGQYADGNWSVKTSGSEDLKPVKELDRTPLHIACEQDDEEMVELLLAHGADPNIADKSRMTALHHAIEESNEEMLRLLLKAGADPTLGNSLIGEDNTPFHAAISRGKHNIAKILLDTGKFDVNKPGSGWLPLHLAGRRGQAKTVTMLLEAGADPSATDSNGKTARDLAVINKRAECVALLDKAAGAGGNH